MFVASPTHTSLPSPVTSLSATLTGPLQLIEKAATLSPFAATLTSFVKPKSFVCHSYKKQGGWGTPFSSLRGSANSAPLRYPLLFSVSSPARNPRGPNES